MKLADSHESSTIVPALPRICACLTVAMLCQVAGSAMAHHGLSGFESEFQTLRGVVTRYEWANPHVYVYVDVQVPDEGTVTWTVEGAWSGFLVNYGFSRDLLEPGDPVELTGRLSRNAGRREMLGYTVSIDGGPAMRFTNLPMRDLAYDVPSPGRGALPSDRVSLSGAYALVGAWLPLNPTQTILTARSPFLIGAPPSRPRLPSGPNDSDLLRAQCIPYSPPFNMTVEGVKGFEIRGGNIAIFDTSVGDVERVVQMTTDSHGASDSDNMQGDSIGYWDGSALVVETVFNDNEQGVIASGLPFSGVSRMEERFELSQDRSMLKYRYSIESPDYLKLPITGSVDWAFRPDIELPRLPCDPENARRFLEEQ
jgi:hypothetical protein